MLTIELKKFINAYWNAISGKPKPAKVLEKFISDREFRGHVMAYERAFPNYELFADDFICEDDKVVVRGRVKGVHKGNILGIPPTGKSIELPFTVIYKVKNDRISKGWLFVDRLELMEQLGINSMN